VVFCWRRCCEWSGSLELHRSFEARGVLVKIKGYELAEWEEWRSRQIQEGEQTRTERYIEIIREKKEFFCQKIVVYPVTGQVMPGEYHFPFQYQLPPTLPGTFYEHGGSFSSGNGYRAEIVYFAKAKIDVKYKHDLKQQINFVVNEKFDKMLQPAYAENNKTFMFTSGRLTAKVWLDKNCYFPGNTVIAKLEANNTSTKPTKKLSVYVYKRLQMRAYVYHVDRTTEIYRQNYAGFPPCFYGIKWLPFPIPLNVQPSTTTAQHVECKYFFVIECDIPGAIDLKVELNTSILAPQWLFSNQPQPPPVVQLPPDVSFRPPWQDEDAVKSCTKCQKKFGLLTRKHHCRNCGHVFCSKCNSRECKIPNLGYVEHTVSVCDGCWDLASKGGQVFQTAPVLPVTPPVEYGVQTAMPTQATVPQ